LTIRFTYATYGHNVYFKRYEDFKDYEYHWIGKWHEITDRRNEFSWQWISRPEDVYGTQPSFATRTVTRTIETDVQVPQWRSEMVTQTQTVLTTARVEQNLGGFATATFANESFRAGDGVTMLAGRDVSLSGLTRATGATSVVTVTASRDVLLTGGKAPAGAADGTLAAIADIRAGQTIDIRGNRYVDLQKDAILKADDNNPATKTDTIKLSAGNTLYVRSDAFGGYNILLYSDGDVEMRSKLDSGHLIDVRAGLGPTGIGSVITDIEADLSTKGSEIIIRAGSNGGSLILPDAQIFTAGPLTMAAPKGQIAHSGGRIAAESLVATARDGIAANLNVRNVTAEVSGNGNLTLDTIGNVVLNSVKVVGGSVNVIGFGNVEARSVVTRPGRGSVSLNSINGDLIIGTVVSNGDFTADTKTGNITQIAGTVIYAAKTNLNGKMGDRFTLDSDDLWIVSDKPGSVAIDHPNNRLFTIHQAYILDGNFTVSTRGDMLVKDVRVRSNSGNHAVSFTAGGNLTFGLINAGDYAVTPDHALADITWEALGLLQPPAYRRRVDVSLTAGGSILEMGPADPSVDLIADQVTLSAGTCIGSLEFAANNVDVVKSGVGSVNWTPMDDIELYSYQAGDITITDSATRPLTLTKVFLADGSLYVNAVGELRVMDVRVDTNSAEHEVGINAVGDVLVGKIDVGDYAATSAEAAALAIKRRLPSARFTSQNDVSITSGGAIRELPTADDAPDIVANRLSLQAAGNISEIELAVNQFASVVSTGGSIDLTENDGVGETSVGLRIVNAAAPQGSLKIVTREGLVVRRAAAGGANGIVQLSSLTDSVVIENTAGVPSAIESSSVVTIESPVDIAIDGAVVAPDEIRYKAAGTVTSPIAGFNYSVNRAIVFDVGGSFDVKGTLESLDRIEIVSHGGQITSSAVIRGKNGVDLPKLVIESWGNRVASGPAAGLYAFRSDANNGLYYSDRGDGHLSAARAAGSLYYRVVNNALQVVTGDIEALKLLPSANALQDQLDESTGMLRFRAPNDQLYFRGRGDSTPYYRWQDVATGRFAFFAQNDATGQIGVFYGTNADPMAGVMYAADNTTQLMAAARGQLSQFERRLTALDPAADVATISSLTADLLSFPAGNLRFTGGAIGAVSNLLALRANGDLSADFARTTWTATATNGVVEIVGGGEVSLNANIRANGEVSIRATGLFAADGSRIDGDIVMTGDIRGQSATDSLLRTYIDAEHNAQISLVIVSRDLVQLRAVDQLLVTEGSQLAVSSATGTLDIKAGETLLPNGLQMRTDGMVRIEATYSDLLVSYPQLSGYSQPFAGGLEAVAFYDFEGYVNLTVRDSFRFEAGRHLQGVYNLNVTSANGTIAYETGGNTTINGDSTLRANGAVTIDTYGYVDELGRDRIGDISVEGSILGYASTTSLKHVDFDANGYVNLDVDVKASDLVRFHATEMISGLDRHKVQVSGSSGVIDVFAEKGNIEIKPFSDAYGIYSAGTVSIRLMGDDSLLLTQPGTGIWGAGGVTFRADKMALNGVVYAGAATISLEANAGVETMIGPQLNERPNTLELSANELSRLTYGTLRLGSETAGKFTLNQGLTMAAGKTLHLLSGAAIDASAGPVSAARLALTAGAAIKLTNTGNALNLIGLIAGDDVAINNGMGLRFGNVDGVNGFFTANHEIVINAPTVRYESTVDLGGSTIQTSAAVDVTGSMLTLNIENWAPTVGTQWTIVNNQSSTPVTGIFTEMPDGFVLRGASLGGAGARLLESGRIGTRAASDLLFQLNYNGGDGNDVVITALDPLNPSLVGTANSDFYLMRRNGDNFELFRAASANPTNLIYRDSLATPINLIINGAGANDSLVIDFSNGSPMPAGSLTYNGSTAGSTPNADTVELRRGSSSGLFHTITHTQLGATSRQVALDTDGPGGAAATVMMMSVSTAVIDNLDATARVFASQLGDETVTMSDIADSNGLQMEFASSGTTPVVRFAIPSAMITVDAAGGNDSITLASVDSAYTGGWTLNGGAGDDSITAASAGTAFTGAWILNGGAGNDSITVSSVAAAHTGAWSIDGGAGNDTIAVVNVAADYTGGWTIDGGEGDDTVRLQSDLTLVAGQSLDVDLSNDAASPGVDDIVVQANTNFVLAGLGAATLRASRSIQMQAGSSIDTVHGPVTIEANRQSAATAGNFTGLSVTNAQIRSNGSGSITLRGRGGNDAAGGQIGVSLTAGTAIVAGRLATVTIDGVGGAASGSGNVGLVVAAGTLSLNAAEGGFRLSGTGGGTGGSSGNIGLSIASDAQVAAIGSFPVDLVGVSGSHADSLGVSVLGAVSAVTNDLLIDGRKGSLGTGGSVGLGAVVSNATGVTILIRADRDITVSAAGDVSTAGGTLTVAADQDFNGTGAVTMLDGALFDAGSGAIEIDAAGAITIGGLLTSNNSTTAVDIHSRGAGIIDAGDSAINIVAPAVGAGIVLRSATGIGSTNALEIDTRWITALNTTSGNIRLFDIGANANTLVIGSASGLAGVANQAEGGVVSVSNNGALMVAANVASVDSIALEAVDGTGSAQTFVLNTATSVISSKGSVSIAAGDDFRAEAGSVIQAASGATVTLAADFSGDQDSGVGTTMWLSGAVRFGGNGAGTAVLRTGADGDLIRLSGTIAGGTGSVTLDAGAGDDTLQLEAGLPTASNVTFLGQAGNDVFRQDFDMPTRWVITQANRGGLTVSGRNAWFQQWENLVGAVTRADQFVFNDGATIDGSLNARGSEGDKSDADTLDYSDYKSRISVDLAAGIATGIGGGLVADQVGSSIENVFGGAGNDLIVCDIDINRVRGNAGKDTINGLSANDILDGALDADIFHLNGNNFEFGELQGGIDVDGQPIAIDTAVNIGTGPVTLNGFNPSFDNFANSIDVYDGAGFALQGNAGANRIHLGFTAVRNTPLVSGGVGDDQMTTSYNNETASEASPGYVTYDGGAGTDSVTLTFTMQQLIAMTVDEIKAVQAYQKAPTGKTLTVTEGNDKGNFRATGFESARIAIYDDQSVFDITSVFQGLVSKAQIILGTPGNDTITGTSASELIFGMGGNDVIDGGAGNDFILGGSGNDQLSGGDNDDDLFGGSGNDTLYGNAKSDRLRGGLGIDVLFGGAGVDWLDGEAGDDMLYGEADPDTLRGSGGNDTLYGGIGNDSLFGDAGNDSLYGGDGNDVLDGGIDGRSRANSDLVDGESGDDEIRTRGNESEFDKIQGGGGTDRLTSTDMSATPASLVLDAFDGLGNGIESVVGNKARIVGNANANVLDFRRSIAPSAFVALINVAAIDGGTGNDTIHGSSGNDTLFGGLGRDMLYGYAGNDVMDGGEEEDSLFGGAGVDQLQGGTGDDSLDGEMGVDTIHGGEGHDTLVGGGDNDTLFGNAGNDLIFGGLGNDRIDGEAGNDRLFGDVGDDTLNGGIDGGTRAEFDLVDGGAGKDVIRTQGRESEYDSIQGGADLDTLINIGTTPSVDFVLSGFDGLSAGIEQLDANNARLTGNADNNRIDLRLNANGTSFVKTLKLTRIAGMEGDDTIYGSSANETIDGGIGADSLYGMAGNDVLFGGSGADYMDGGAGADTMNGEDGADTLRGGDGVDQLVFSGDLDSLDRVEDLVAADFLHLIGYGSAMSYAKVDFNSTTQMLVVPTSTPKRIMLPSMKAKPTTAQVKIAQTSTMGIRRV
jgi:Ca2+-binding RTX toxin-like protein